MNIPALPSGLHPEDYDRIEAAVMETVRGRWFLLEYARRQRAAETERLVQAVDRLERYAASRESACYAQVAETPEPGRISTVDLARARVLAAKAHDFAWALRERGLDEDFCAEADELAAQFAEFAGGASGEDDANVARPPAMFASPVEEAEAPEIESSSAEQGVLPATEAREFASETQQFESEAEEFWSTGSAPEVFTPVEIVAVDPRLAALSRLDHLSLDEKLVLFG